MQLYRFDRDGDPLPNGSIPVYTDWTHGPTLAGVRNCPISTGKRLTVYVRGEPVYAGAWDARCRIGKQACRGTLAAYEEGFVMHVGQKAEPLDGFVAALKKLGFKSMKLRHGHGYDERARLHWHHKVRDYDTLIVEAEVQEIDRAFPACEVAGLQVQVRLTKRGYHGRRRTPDDYPIIDPQARVGSAAPDPEFGFVVNEFTSEVMERAHALVLRAMERARTYYRE